MIWRTVIMCGRKRVHIASIANRFRSAAASNSARASAAFRVSDFSTSTGLPAASASSACSRCSECGVAM